jgi:hypothetical protein
VFFYSSLRIPKNVIKPKKRGKRPLTFLPIKKNRPVLFAKICLWCCGVFEPPLPRNAQQLRKPPHCTPLSHTIRRSAASYIRTCRARHVTSYQVRCKKKWVSLGRCGLTSLTRPCPYLTARLLFPSPSPSLTLSSFSKTCHLISGPL